MTSAYICSFAFADSKFDASRWHCSAPTDLDVIIQGEGARDKEGTERGRVREKETKSEAERERDIQGRATWALLSESRATTLRSSSSSEMFEADIMAALKPNGAA